MLYGYIELANAIILKAVDDYRKTEVASEKTSIIRFFRSDWFSVLTDLDPEVLIEKLKKEERTYVN